MRIWYLNNFKIYEVDITNRVASLSYVRENADIFFSKEECEKALRDKVLKGLDVTS